MTVLTSFEAHKGPVELGQELTNHLVCICCLGPVSAQQLITDFSTLICEYA